MAVSENARLAVDDYSFDPSTESGSTNFSVLRGVFVFTSGLIGRDDPDDVHIDTPVGSIGIRGTIIAGDINPGAESQISVVEGAIVITNGAGVMTLSTQFETVSLGDFNAPMQSLGVLSANDFNIKFAGVSDVAPTLFSAINDAAQEQDGTDAPMEATPDGEAPVEDSTTPEEPAQE